MFTGKSKHTEGLQQSRVVHESRMNLTFQASSASIFEIVQAVQEWKLVTEQVGEVREYV